MRMTSCCARICFLWLCVFAVADACAHAGEHPPNDPDVQKTLKAMHNASTWFHPDLYGMTQGMLAYAHHHYAQAMKDFKYGALYADKLSQLSLGLMYMNGQGTAKDPVTAYAWLDLAAERGYPKFVATRDDLAKTLSADQLARAKRLRAKLAQRYGDAVAKHRMAVQLRQGMMNITGSHTGFDSGVIQLSAVRCGPQLIIGGRAVPQIGCGGMNDFRRKDNWQPKLYFAARDREWMAQVTVGPLTDAGSAKSNNKAKEKSANPGDTKKVDGGAPAEH